MTVYCVVLIGLALVLAWSLISPRGEELDERLFLAINQRPLPHPLELPLRLISHLGLLPTNLLIWAGITAFVDRRIGLVGGAGLVAAWVTCRVVKRMTNRPRPYQAVPEARLVGLAPSLSSFPSSHAAHVVLTAVVASHLLGFNPWETAVAYLLAAIVCYARIYLGAHYPRDVLAGIVIGLAAGLTTLVMASR
jgi:membrane-associated phospholipid phosphatase